METQPFETVAEKYLSSGINIILFTEKFTVVTSKNLLNDRLYAHASTKKKGFIIKHLHLRSTFSQSLMASVGESHFVENTQISYLSVMESTLVRPVVINRCC